MRQLCFPPGVFPSLVISAGGSYYSTHLHSWELECLDSSCSSTSAFVGWCARGLQQVGTQGLYFSSLVLTLSDTHLRAVEGGREYSTTIPALPESWGSSLMAVTWLTWTHWLTVVSGQHLGVSFYISMQCWDTSPNEWKYGILFAAEEVVRAGVLSYAPVSESEHVSLFHPS